MADSSATPLKSDSLARLHRRAIADRTGIRGLLERVRRDGVQLWNGVNSRNQTRTAFVKTVAGDSLVLSTSNIAISGSGDLYFNFSVDGAGHFFATQRQGSTAKGELRVRLPLAIYEAERRDSGRLPSEGESEAPGSVVLELPGGAVSARVRDVSQEGLGVELPSGVAVAACDELRIWDPTGTEKAGHSYAKVRHVRENSNGIFAGLSVSRIRPGPKLPIESRNTILGPQPLASTAWRQLQFGRAAIATLPLAVSKRLGRRSKSPVVNVVQYDNGCGHPLRAIVTSTGDTKGAPAVVIPPAWGRTKETLAPLAQTLLATYARAGESLVVIRFDGTNRRGESWIDPSNREPGRESLAFTFSQAVDDIHATLRFLRDTPAYATRDACLVTFSLAAIEGRRAVARDVTGMIRGWLPVVGMVDLQSGLRAVSGGVDYALGLRRGLEFGLHELVGVLADMDRTGRDALEHRMVFAEDARLDMAEVKVPVTWIHGRHDAWIELDRVQELMSTGDQTNRRLIEVPTGHQLRTSREALDTFQLIASETSRILLGRELPPRMPSLARLQARREAERRRLDTPALDLRDFWEQYLLGRTQEVGFELLTATTAYQELMERQTELLDLESGQVVLDVGSGTGGFPARLSPSDAVKVLAIDFIQPALTRARSQLNRTETATTYDALVSDLDIGNGRQLPLRDDSIDAVMASLFLSYIRDPEWVVHELARVLKPGGRIVLSSLKRDADISQIYVDGAREVLAADRQALFGDLGTSYSEVQRQFLNDASRILDLEEKGLFRFFGAGELAGLLRRAGFRGVRVERAFGTPSQAVVAVGVSR